MEISALMSVYNAEGYVKDAIESILSQTFKDFEFIIINDASKDKSLEIIKSFQDSRIKLIDNSINLGLTKSLNIGLKSAKGKYIARMDADDISHPDRFKKQLEFLEAYNDIALVGSFVEVINEKNFIIDKRELIQDPDLIKFRMLFSNQFVHSSIFFRKALIDQIGGYNEKYKYSQDFELLSRLNQDHNMTNLPEYLLKLRVHKKRISHKNLAPQKKFAIDIIKNNLNRYSAVSLEEASLIYESYYGYTHDMGKISHVKDLYKEILDSYLIKNNLSGEKKEKIIQEYEKLLLRISEVNKKKSLARRLAKKFFNIIKY